MSIQIIKCLVWQNLYNILNKLAKTLVFNVNIIFKVVMLLEQGNNLDK